MTKKNKNKSEYKSVDLRSLGAAMGLTAEEMIDTKQAEISDDTDYSQYSSEDCFINPYTFFPISSENPERQAVKKGDKTGVIDCSIEIKSPTFIPNTTRSFKTKDNDHYFYEFYSYEDLTEKEKGAPANPVMPGSEIRGMVRNIYEQLTNSCFLEVDENNLPYKRTALPKKAALLKYNAETESWDLCYKTDTNGKISSIETKRLFCEDSFIAIDGAKPDEWFTGLKFAGFDHETRKVIYNYEKDKSFPKTKYKIGDTAYLQYDRDGKIKSISDREVFGFTNRKITITKKNTMKAEVHAKVTKAYKFNGIEYNWGDTVYEKTTTGKRAEMITKDINSAQACDKDINDNPTEYVLHLVPLMTTKKYFSLYKEDTEHLERIRMTPEKIERFENILKSYTDGKVNIMGKSEDKIKYYNQYYQMFREHKTLLVYADENKTYLSPSCITKEYFENKVSEILKNQSGHDKCTDIESLCPACRLFGMIGKSGSNTGRVRICDTHESEGVKFDLGEVTLPVLGTPRISATEFYLLSPDEKALTWNYDYWVEKYAEGKFPPIVKNCMPSLAGRKVYWHGKMFDVNDKSNAKMNMRCTVRPITAGKFKFKVYFEDLESEELESLIFCLNLNGKGVHKIGKGKPIGMGDIEVTVDRIQLRNYKYIDNKILSDFENISVPDLSSIMVKRNREITQIIEYTKPMSENEQKLVAYPTIRDTKKPEIFQWFSRNRGTIQKPTINRDGTLPKLGECKVLKKY